MSFRSRNGTDLALGERMMRKSIAAAVVAGALFAVGAAPADAAIRYQYNGSGGMYDLVLDQPPPSTGIADYAAPLGSVCNGQLACNLIRFGYDEQNGIYITGIGSLDYPNDLYGNVFVIDNWSDFGTHSGFGGTLTITDIGAAPEPGTWAMLILGFGIAGTALRRRRREQPEAQPAFA